MGDDRSQDQVTHYYPFGSSFGESMNPEEQPYKFGNKEFITDNGLNWYDFSARTYDPAIGRFTSYDPLASKFTYNTPMVYCSNNPVFFIDPTGLEDIPYDQLDMRKYNYNNDLIWLDEILVTPPKSNNNITSSISNFMYKNQNKISNITAAAIIEATTDIGSSFYLRSNKAPITIQTTKVFSTIQNIKYLKAVSKISGNIGTFLLLGADWEAYQLGEISLGRFTYHAIGAATFKPKQGKIQANFEWRNTPTGEWQGNGHLNIINN